MSEENRDGEETAPRLESRVTINKEFESFDAFMHEYVTNISRSGVFVRARETLPVGTRVNLRFTVIMDQVETIEGLGEVVRVQDEPRGMGLVFRELTQYSRQLIERLISAPFKDGDKAEDPGTPS